MELQGRKKFDTARILFIIIVLFAVIQLVPYGRKQSNPPSSHEPRWDSLQTRETFFRVCKNCHSNETVWPWYGSIAPFSWLVQSDVDEGRSKLNVSEWGIRENRGDKAAGEVREGDMPPWYYQPLHPKSRLTEDERTEFIRGLVLTFGDHSGK
jgi:hypothetical protein